MRNLLRSLVTGAVVLATLAFGMPATAQAASGVGYDVSFPQCGSTLPTGQAFAVVGVNGGRATTANPCLSAQLRWAARSSGAVAAQPKVQLYLNTGNPGQVREQVTTWPRTGNTPYGACDGRNTMACSYRYGAERARNSVTAFLVPAAKSAGLDPNPARYRWWLDVESVNTWQSGFAGAQSRNRAALEGMTAYLNGAGARVGLYALPTEWQQIVGPVGPGSNLRTLSSWLPGATTLSGATANCAKPPLVAGGKVVLAQYVRNGLDHNRSCV